MSTETQQAERPEPRADDAEKAARERWGQQSMWSPVNYPESVSAARVGLRLLAERDDHRRQHAVAWDRAQKAEARVAELEAALAAKRRLPEGHDWGTVRERWEIDAAADLSRVPFSVRDAGRAGLALLDAFESDAPPDEPERSGPLPTFEEIRRRLAETDDDPNAQAQWVRSLIHAARQQAPLAEPPQTTEPEGESLTPGQRLLSGFTALLIRDDKAAEEFLSIARIAVNLRRELLAARDNQKGA